MPRVHLVRHRSRATGVARGGGAAIGLPLATVALSPDGSVCAWSPAASRLFGWSESEMLGRQATVLEAPVLDSLSAQLERLRCGASVAGQRVRVRAKDGRTVTAQLFGVARAETDGAFAGADLAFVDMGRGVSRQRRDRLLAKVVGQMPSMLVIAGPDGRVTYANRAYLEHTGQSESEVRGRSVFHTAGEANVRRRSDDVSRSVAATGSWEGDLRVVHKDGNICWEHTTIHALPGSDGRVDSYVKTVVDITDRKMAEDHLRQLAYRDPLTGLPNRVAMEAHLRRAVQRSAKNATRLGVMFIDCDGFKAINDTYGHGVGDAALFNTARILVECVRDEDFVARLAGDEFVVVLDDVPSREDAGRVAQKLLDTLRRRPVHRVREAGKERGVHLAASVGVAMYPDDAQDALELVTKADRAMYRAKQLGKERYAHYAPELDSPLLVRGFVEEPAREAFREGRYRLDYQPIVDLAEGHVWGLEALLRCTGPRAPELQPAEVVHRAEQQGWIRELGQFVLWNAAAQAATLSHSDLLPRVSVNVSSVELQSDAFVRTYEEVLRRLGARPEQLMLEVRDEGLQLVDPVVRRTLAAVHELGTKIALDDFGRGAESLTRLVDVQVDILKVDGGVSSALDARDERGRRARTVVKAIGAIAEQIGAIVIAKGIERPSQSAALAEMGYRYAQGFLFAPPLLGTEVQGFVRDFRTVW